MGQVVSQHPEMKMLANRSLRFFCGDDIDFLIAAAFGCWLTPFFAAHSSSFSSAAAVAGVGPSCSNKKGKEANVRKADQYFARVFLLAHCGCRLDDVVILGRRMLMMTFIVSVYAIVM